jgi:alpha-glucosidase (family GH31 glycosyl hydrolase)
LWKAFLFRVANTQLIHIRQGEDEMQRRAFLRNSAIGIGTLAGMCAADCKAEGLSRNQQPVMAMQSRTDESVAVAEEKQLTWGINAISLKSPWSSAPSLDDLLADQEHTFVLNSFYRAGGENRPATPIEWRLAYTNEALFVVFRCHECNMSFPAINQEADWYSMGGSPGGSELNTPTSCPPFPDAVDLFIQPDMSVPLCYQFAATPDGLQFACERLARFKSDAEPTPDEDRTPAICLSKITAFEASVTRKTNEWLVFFQIPWKTMGGKPKSYFGLLPVRTRWRDGEFSSPVAVDFVEQLPLDLFIETHFNGGSAQQTRETSLCRLPSGLLRWQRPAALLPPDSKTLQQIWRMESFLTTPTDLNNFGQRLYLTQRWMDMLALEGFDFRPDTGTILKDDLTPYIIRQKVNGALRENAPWRAYRLLDTYLGKLDKGSRNWFADGSPGNIRQEEWVPVSNLESLEVQGNLLLMRCLAGHHRVDLRLALPKTGGIRIFGKDEGYFKPVDLLALRATQSSSSCSIETGDGKILIRRDPFSISFHNSAGDEVTQIGANCLAFRFSSDGKIVTVDFKNHLAPTEVIYGFGERYDRFNQNGNVLTLWGMDNWMGNWSGLRNETYKGLPVFHSSQGYMVFSNSSYRLRADIGRMNPGQYRITQHGPIFDYYFWIGPPTMALQSYTALTGKPILPPKWAFEPWIGRGEDAWLMSPLHNAVAEEESVVRRWEALDVPHSAIYAEGASASSPALNEFMAAHRTKVLSYFMPAVRPWVQESLMPELKFDELPIVHCGSEAASRELAYVDFTNPNALEMVRRWWQRELDLGVAGGMVDYGDGVPEEAVFYSGERGDKMHNFYYYDYHRTVSEVFQERRGNDFILYARGATPGTQKWVGQFAGDHAANFDGLKAVVTGMLNLCACGYSNWGSDLGGYFGWPEPAVFMRWAQFGTFSPLMRPHGKAPRDPWYYGEAAVENYKFCAWVRENLLNYIYNTAVIAHESGISIIRSMPIGFPGEPGVAAVRDQYMFGEDLLVAPVVSEHNSRTILFPSGQWTNLWNGKTVSGPANLETSVPLDEIEVYLRPGAVVPVQLNEELQFGKSMTSKRVTALVVTPPNKNEIVSRLNAHGEAARVKLQSKGRKVGWILENFPEMRYLLVYGGIPTATVRMDGKILSKSTATRFDSMSTGWQIDPACNRLIIPLPSAQTSSSIIKVELDFHSS